MLSMSGNSIQSLIVFARNVTNRSFDDVGGNTREEWASELIERLDEEGILDELYIAVCKEYSDYPAVKKLQVELKGAPLVESKHKIDASDLFSKFSEYDDFAAVQRSFLCACKDTVGDFSTIRPDRPSLNELGKIKAQVEIYEPKLAVQFAQYLLLELDVSSAENRLNLKSAIESWRDRIAQQYNITPETPQPIKKEQQGYLLVALRGTGQKSGDRTSVTVFTELRIAGKDDPIEFGAETITCFLDEVAAHLSTVILEAEEALIAYGIGRITLELFLPWNHLDISVADWEILNRKGRPRSLGKHRGIVIRSYDRAEQGATRSEVQRKWKYLEECVKQGDACDRFHPQETCPEAGDLEGKLKDKPGLKLIAELPKDREDCLDIFDDIIESGVPIALWFNTVEGLTAAEKLAEFNTLLQEHCSLTDFSQLADRWRDLRRKHPNQHLRMLCDCPDRWPAKPFYTDPLVAS